MVLLRTLLLAMVVEMLPAVIVSTTVLAAIRGHLLGACAKLLMAGTVVASTAYRRISSQLTATMAVGGSIRTLTAGLLRREGGLLILHIGAHTVDPLPLVRPLVSHHRR